MAIETVQRSVRLDLYLPAEQAEQKQKILSSIRQYRATLRHCSGMLAMAADAGADIEWTDDDNVRVLPHKNSESAKIILALSTRQSTATRAPRAANHKRGDGGTYHVKLPNGPVYELRAELVRQMPTMMSFVLDSARRDIHMAWTAKDPALGGKNVRRNYLVINGARMPPRFERRGIGLPVSTARPVLGKRSLTLRWDKSIGEIEFKLGELDGGRLYVWKALRDGDDGWSLGTVFLTEQDGKISVVLSHARPTTVKDVDPQRTLSVSIPNDDETLLRFSAPDGLATADTIDSAAVLAFLAQSRARRSELEKRRGANGSPRRPWGYRKGWEAAQETLDRCTLNRTRRSADYNHAWTRRIVARAVSWRCGVIMVPPPPQKSFNGGPLVGSIGNHPWNWTDFMSSLRYKAEAVGITVVVAAADQNDAAQPQPQEEDVAGDELENET